MTGAPEDQDATRVRRWEELTSADIHDAAARDPVAILPVTAVEQHGPHLPVSTDRVIGDGIVRAALDELDDLPALLLPTQSVGTSEEHAGFAGTVSLTPETLHRVLLDTGASVARAGIRRLVLVNSHGGNRAVVDQAALALRRREGMLVVKAHWFRFPRPDDVELPDSEWHHGLHGGAVETAMMLHLRPDLVRHDAVASFPSLGEELDDRLRRLGPEGEAAFAWTAEDLGDAGVVGDATLADAAMGRRLVAHYGACLADVLRDARDFPLSRLR